MGNSISYSAGGKILNFLTPLDFGKLTNAQVATKVFIEVSFDRDSRLMKGEIPTTLTDEEKTHMTDADILEWLCVTNIEFIDYTCKKKMSFTHMSDYIDKVKVESFN